MHWGRLLADVTARAASVGRWYHSLGRVVVSSTGCRDSKSLQIIDGQQRLITVCIFLAAIRDFAAEQPSGSTYATRIDHILFPRGVTGACRVIPTYFDRRSFNQAVKADASPMPRDDGDHISCCRAFFDGNLAGVISRLQRTSTVEACSALTTALLDGCSILLFNIIETDLPAVYERLAVREDMLAPLLARVSSGVPLDQSDLARNYVLSFFPDEERRAKAFKELWLPIEIQCSIDADGGITAELNKLLLEFSQSNRNQLVVSPASQLNEDNNRDITSYSGFRELLERRLAAAGVPAPFASKPTEAETKVVEEVLQELTGFAELRYNSKAESSSSSSLPVKKAPFNQPLMIHGEQREVMVSVNTAKFATTRRPTGSSSRVLKVRRKVSAAAPKNKN